MSLICFVALVSTGATASYCAACVQIKAANTLADLTVDKSVGSKLVDAGGLNTLVELCKRDNGLIMQYTAVAIGNISSSSKRCVCDELRINTPSRPLIARSVVLRNHAFVFSWYYKHSFADERL